MSLHPVPYGTHWVVSRFEGAAEANLFPVLGWDNVEPVVGTLDHPLPLSNLSGEIHVHIFGPLSEAKCRQALQAVGATEFVGEAHAYLADYDLGDEMVED